MVAERRATLVVLDDLQEGVNSLAFELSVQELDLEDEYFAFAGPLRAEVEIRRARDHFALKGRVGFRATSDCYRCGEPVTESLEAVLRLLVQRRQASSQEREMAAEDGFVEIVDPGTREIDLAPYLREAVILELPMRLPRKDEKGRCPVCGKDLEADFKLVQKQEPDPRWAALKNIKFS